MDNFNFIKLKKASCKVYDNLQVATCSLHRNDIHIFHLNIRSIRRHFDELRVFLHSVLNQVDIYILALTEVNLQENDVFCYELEGFKSIKKLRSNKRGGGITIYVNNKIDFTEITYNTISFESILCKVTLQDVEYIIMTCYRPPNSNKNIFMDELEAMLTEIKCKNVIFIGDININICNKLDLNVMTYRNLLSTYGYDELIKDYTREEIVREKLIKSCLDHIYIRTYNNESEGIVIKHKISDHYIIGIKIKSSNTILEKKEKCDRYLTYIDNKTLCKKIQEYQWNDILNDTDPESIYKKLNFSLNKLYQESTKIKPKLPVRGNHKGWISDDILKVINERDIAFRKLKNCPTNKGYKDAYVKLRNKTVKIIRKAKNIYYNKLFENTKSCKLMWSSLNKITGRGRTDHCDLKIVKCLDEKSNIAVITSKLCEAFADPNSKFKINCDRKFNGVEDAMFPSSMFIPMASTKNISKIVMEMGNKGPGHDNIRIKDIKCHKQLMEIITNLINYSLQNGIVPDGLKIAVVRPIPKDKKMNDYGNFRPISILSCVDKILEKYVANFLMNFAIKFNHISRNQYGFQQKKGTKHVLQEFSNCIRENLDKNNNLLVLFIDLRKAFDSVNFDILLNKLYNIGVRGPLFDWFNSYLKNRKIKVKLNNYTSEERLITSGVPQGSVLGPLLFIIYINSIFSTIKNCKIYMYADDAVLISAHKNFDKCVAMLQEDFNMICKWCHDNDLTINEKKTKVMHITDRSRDRKDVVIKTHNHDCLHRLNALQMNNYCDCILLEQVYEHNYLGIIIDANFRFGLHTNYLYKKLKKISYMMFHIKDMIPVKTKTVLYSSLVESILRYGILVWGSAATVYLKRLCKCQDKIVRYVYNNYNYKNEDNIYYYQKLKFLPLNLLYKYILIIENYFSKNYKCIEMKYHTMTKRSKERYNIPNYFNKHGKNHLKVTVPTIFNEIPPNLRNIEKMATIKNKIKNWLLQI